MMALSLPKIAASVAAAGTIGGGALALDKLHVASEDFEKYIQQQQMADEREYVQDLKKEIRDVKAALISHPDEEWLQEGLAELIDELCELRPDDRMCDGDAE
jgi:hypothetical protein